MVTSKKVRCRNGLVVQIDELVPVEREANCGYNVVPLNWDEATRSTTPNFNQPARLGRGRWRVAAFTGRRSFEAVARGSADERGEERVECASRMYVGVRRELPLCAQFTARVVTASRSPLPGFEMRTRAGSALMRLEGPAAAAAPAAVVAGSAGAGAVAAADEVYFEQDARRAAAAAGQRRAAADRRLPTRRDCRRPAARRAERS